MAKKTGVILVLALVVIVAILAFRPDEPSDDRTLKIGATLALTGDYAAIGEAGRNGMELAIEEINAKGGVDGKELELIAEDNQGDAKTALNNVNKFIYSDDVDVIFSVFTHITSAINPVVAGKDRVLVYASTFKDIAAGNPRFFRDFFDVFETGQLIADIADRNGYKRLKFLTEVSDQCLEVGKGLEQKAPEYGISVVQEETYLTTDKDLLTPLTKLKGGEPADAIVMCIWRHEPIVMKEMAQLGMLDTPTIHVIAPYLPAADTAELRRAYEGSGAISTWFGIPEEAASDLQKSFIDKYTQRFGVKPLTDSSYTYDDIYAIADALDACTADDYSQDCIAENLKKTDLDGAGGHLSFDEDRSSKRPLFAIKVVNGIWEEVPIE